MAAVVVPAVADWSGVEPDPLRVGPWERRVAQAYPPWRRREWLIGRLTARAALRMRYGDRAARAEVVRDRALGAPVVRRLPGAVISLSHAGDRVACAVAPAGMRIGIDVERRGGCDADLARRVLGRGERLPADLDPTVIWTVKEAAYKAVSGRWPGLRAYRVVGWLPADHAAALEGPAVAPVTAPAVAPVTALAVAPAVTGAPAPTVARVASAVVCLPDGGRLTGWIFEWGGAVVAAVGHGISVAIPTVLDPRAWCPTETSGGSR